MNGSRFSFVLIAALSLAVTAPSALALTFAQAKTVANGLGLDLLPDANLDQWIPVTLGSASVNTAGTTASLSATGAASSARLVSPAGNVVGVLATFNATPGAVDSVEVETFGFVGFRPNGNDVLVNLWAQEFQGDQYWLGYLVREIDEQGATVRQLTRGAIGGLNSWNPAQPIVLGFAVVDDELWFFANTQPILSRVKLFGGISGYVEGLQPQVAVFSTSEGDTVTTQVGNVWLITRP